MRGDTIQRRRLLRLTGATAVGGLAGCTGGSDDGTGGKRSDDGGTTIEYTDWLPERESIGFVHYSFESYDFATVRENEGAFIDKIYDELRDVGRSGTPEVLGLAFESIDRVTEVTRGLTVHEGAFERAEASMRSKARGTPSPTSAASSRSTRERGARSR